MYRFLLKGSVRLVILSYILLILLNGASDAEQYSEQNSSFEKASINFYYDNRKLEIKSPVYIKKNRYYLPVFEVLQSMGGYTIQLTHYTSIVFKNKTVTLNTENNNYHIGKELKSLKEPVIFIAGKTYISFFDLVKVLDLKTRWDIEGQSMFLFSSKGAVTVVKDSEKNIANPALIRLEDITSGNSYKDGKSLEKLRIVSEYLYNGSIPFYIAWVPRYMELTNGIDIDPSMQNNMYNADFIFTLDYLMDRGGIIGLHGYTHQYGRTDSIEGREFHLSKSNDRIPQSREYVESRIKFAKESAAALNIPVAFFEAPHYAANPDAFRVIEQNFNVIYEPYTPDGLHEMNRKIVTITGEGISASYIPTPLDYVEGKNDTDRMLNKINSLQKDVLASFFYHPYIEFEFIKIPEAINEYPEYTYADISPLHKIIDKLESRGYKFTTIQEILLQASLNFSFH